MSSSSRYAWGAAVLTLALACSNGSGSPMAPTDDVAPEKPAGSSGGKKPSAGGPSAPSAGPRDKPVEGDEMPAPPPYQTSKRSLLQWKRQAAFEADLMGALQLSREQICVEVGGKNCVRDVHLVPLGGNDPYESGLMKPSPEPLATTSSVVDRVLLSACSTRARLDKEGTPVVLKALKLEGPLPSAADPAIAATVTELYRRFLARDPTADEVQLVTTLANGEGEPALSSQEFAALACFTIGSSTESLFF